MEKINSMGFVVKLAALLVVCQAPLALLRGGLRLIIEVWHRKLILQGEPSTLKKVLVMLSRHPQSRNWSQ